MSVARKEPEPTRNAGLHAFDAALEPEDKARSKSPLAVARTALTSLSEREYAWFFAGNMTFFMGMQMQFVLRGYLGLELTNSAKSLGLISIMISLPMLIAAPFGGVIADRVNKRTLLIITQSLAALSSLLVAVLIIGGWIEFWHLLAISLMTGLIFSFNMPARQALVPQLVPQHKLTNAISLQMGGMTFTQICAPALAGLLIGPLGALAGGGDARIVGAGWVYLITAGLFGVATASEFHLPKHGMKAVSRGSAFFEDFTEGFRYVLGHRLIRLLIATSLLVPLFGFPVQQMLPVFAREVFDRGPGGLGLLAMMTGIGGLTGATISATMDGQPHKGRLLLGGGLLMGVSLFAFASAPSFALALPCLALAGAGQMLFNATNNTVIQASLEPHMRGRVMSVLLMSFGLMPLGVVPISAAADAIGAPKTVAIAAALFLALLLTIFAVSKQLRTLRLDALRRAELSPARAAELVAAGRISQAEADRMTGRTQRAPELAEALEPAEEPAPASR